MSIKNILAPCDSSEISRLQQFNSPSMNRISTLPATARSNWYYDHDDGDAKQSKILKRGWLDKQSSKLFGSWRQRWAVLLENHLVCYDDEREVKSGGRAILLTGKNVSEVISGDTNGSGNGNSSKFIFHIAPVELNSDGKTSVSSKNVEVFRVGSEQERKDWLKALRKAMYSRVGGAIFGGSLEDTLCFERTRNPSRIVPEIVEECVRFLKENGLETDGIFRMTGKKSLQRKLQERFDRGERPTLVLPSCSSLPEVSHRSLSSSTSSSSSALSPHVTVLPTEVTEVHSAASLLKSYLLDLPEPIIPVNFYDDIMTVVTREFELDSEASIDKISSSISRLPPNSYNLLRYICEFLKLVGDNEVHNRMSYNNLAKVFCNAILEPEVDDPALLMGTADNRAKAITIMITYLNRIFKDDWKLDQTGRRSSRLSRSYDDLCVDGLPSSFPGDRKTIVERFVAQLTMKTTESSKSFEVPNSQKSVRDEEEVGLTGVSQNYKNRCSGSSTSTISSFFDMLPRFSSSRKNVKEKSSKKDVSAIEFPDSPIMPSSYASSGFMQDLLQQTSQSGTGNIRRSCSVRDQHTREKLFMMYDSQSSLSRHDSRQDSLVLEEVEENGNHPCPENDVINYLLGVKPKSLPVDDLIEHFYRLQESLALEHKRVHDLKRGHERELKRLAKELEEHKESREQAVTRVVEVQTKLENYFLKFGPL